LGARIADLTAATSFVSSLLIFAGTIASDLFSRIVAAADTSPGRGGKIKEAGGKQKAPALGAGA
jgi:hypothetical protein